MAYIEYNRDFGFHRIVENDSLKNFFLTDLFSNFIPVTDDQFLKLRLERLYVPTYNTSSQQLIWQPEITNNSTIIGNDGLTYKVIYDLNSKDFISFTNSFNIFCKNNPKLIETRPDSTQIINYKNWLESKSANNWNDVTFPIVGKTRNEALQDIYSSKIYSLIEL